MLFPSALVSAAFTVKKRLNRKLAIEGILLTMVDFRTNYARDIASRVHTTYGSQIEVFENVIPMSVKAAETSALIVIIPRLGIQSIRI